MKFVISTIFVAFIMGMHSIASADNWDEPKIIRGKVAVHAHSEDCYVWVSGMSGDLEVFENSKNSCLREIWIFIGRGRL
jgi:hypothetical protein